jgi:hypothetical protein
MASNFEKIAKFSKSYTAVTSKIQVYTLISRHQACSIGHLLAQQVQACVLKKFMDSMLKTPAPIKLLNLKHVYTLLSSRTDAQGTLGWGLPIFCTHCKPQSN